MRGSGYVVSDILYVHFVSWLVDNWPEASGDVRLPWLYDVWTDSAVLPYFRRIQSPSQPGNCRV